jgi:hypothetical protein
LRSHWKITTDKHGLCVEIEGCEEYIVLDMSGGAINIYVTNENQEVDDGPVGSVVLLKHV